MCEHGSDERTPSWVPHVVGSTVGAVCGFFFLTAVVNASLREASVFSLLAMLAVPVVSILLFRVRGWAGSTVRQSSPH
jgi:hypothetical protein